jgi:uncharacterized protein
MSGRSIRVLTAYLLCLTAAGARGQDSSARPDLIKPEVVIPVTEARVFHSNLFDQDFLLSIKLPMSYSKGEAVYPVMYCTDANRSFPLYATASRIMEFPNPEISETVIVGIGYSIQGGEDWAAWRTRDLTPTRNSEAEKYCNTMLSRMSGGKDIAVTTGGASRFLDFIRNELIPFIETNYRVSRTDRALAGYSYGGLFTLFALFRHPETFVKYFVGSPSLDWDGGVLFRDEAEFASAHHDLPVRVFMTAGGSEVKSMIENVEKMAACLRSRNYARFQLETRVFDDETHTSGYSAAVSRALKIFYKK